jgi:hypothetical protein
MLPTSTAGLSGRAPAIVSPSVLYGYGFSSTREVSWFACIVEVRPAEVLGRYRVVPPVAGQTVGRGSNDREFLGPGGASGTLQRASIVGW